MEDVDIVAKNLGNGDVLTQDGDVVSTPNKQTPPGNPVLRVNEQQGISPVRGTWAPGAMQLRQFSTSRQGSNEQTLDEGLEDLFTGGVVTDKPVYKWKRIMTSDEDTETLAAVAALAGANGRLYVGELTAGIWYYTEELQQFTYVGWPGGHIQTGETYQGRAYFGVERNQSQIVYVGIDNVVLTKSLYSFSDGADAVTNMLAVDNVLYFAVRYQDKTFSIKLLYTDGESEALITIGDFPGVVPEGGPSIGYDPIDNRLFVGATNDDSTARIYSMVVPAGYTGWGGWSLEHTIDGSDGIRYPNSFVRYLDGFFCLIISIDNHEHYVIRRNSGSWSTEFICEQQVIGDQIWAKWPSVLTGPLMTGYTTPADADLFYSDPAFHQEETSIWIAGNSGARYLHPPAVLNYSLGALGFAFQPPQQGGAGERAMLLKEVNGTLYMGTWNYSWAHAALFALSKIPNMAAFLNWSSGYDPDFYAFATDSANHLIEGGYDYNVCWYGNRVAMYNCATYNWDAELTPGNSIDSDFLIQFAERIHIIYNYIGKIPDITRIYFAVELTESDVQDGVFTLFTPSSIEPTRTHTYDKHEIPFTWAGGATGQHGVIVFGYVDANSLIFTPEYQEYPDETLYDNSLFDNYF